MVWYVYLTRFIAGLSLANGVPHFVNGISGKRFQSPFASPPGVGESSPLVNVIWGMANFVIGYVLIYAVGDFGSGLTLDALMIGLGALVTSAGLAIHFGRVRGDQENRERSENVDT
jgi:hypothetical protein